MWLAVAGPVSPVTTTVYVMTLSFSVNVAVPVPVTALAGTSLAPLSVAVYVTVGETDVLDLLHDARSAAEAATAITRKDMSGSSRGLERSGCRWTQRPIRHRRKRLPTLRAW